jgi:PAS domain S-box-containing protein
MMLAKQTARTSQALWKQSKRSAATVAAVRQSDASAFPTDQQIREWSNRISFTSPDSDFCGFSDKSITRPRPAVPSEWSSSMSFSSPESDFVGVNAGREYQEPTWSEQLSFGSPENDFTAAKVVTAMHAPLSGSEWSHNLSFASPEADFASQNVATAEPFSAEWSQNMSFASPDSDFTAQDVADAEPLNSEWSRGLSFASPEADFAAGNVATAAPLNIEWSRGLSFASPEADFVAENVAAAAPLNIEWSRGLSFASPEADFTAENVATTAPLSASEWSESLSFATPEADFTVRLPEQFISVQAPLPRNMTQVMQDPRAVVVTSAASPFKVVNVNEAWVGLCGYKPEEALGKSLGSLLQGSKTDTKVANSMVRRLHLEEYAEAVVFNYTKEGREFKNVVRVAPMFADDGTIEHFVGVLQEISNDSQVNLSQS